MRPDLFVHTSLPPIIRQQLELIQTELAKGVATA
jgi:hypothetical protein